jgi:Flp pilus assembly pilin Flp
MSFAKIVDNFDFIFVSTLNNHKIRDDLLPILLIFAIHRRRSAISFLTVHRGGHLMRMSSAKLLGGRGGATAIEYSLIASLVAVTVVVGLQTIGHTLTGAVSNFSMSAAAAP